MIVLQLPQIKQKTEVRPKKCPHCQGETFQRWGKVKKKIKDTKAKTARMYRYKCTRCKRTFRHYPGGVQRASQTERLKKLAVICWSLGLSHRSVSLILSGFGVSLSRMSVWRDVQQQAESLRKQNKWTGVRVLGLDGAWVLSGGKKRGVVVAIDMGDGKPVAIGQFSEWDRFKLKRWLQPLVQQMGVSVIVSDDLHIYKDVAERLGLEHQVCQFHVRRWVGKRCYQFRRKIPEEWHWVIDEVEKLMKEMPLDGGTKLHELWKQLPGREGLGDLNPMDKLRLMLVRMSQDWERYIAFYHDPGIPWTNNLTEQAIGRMKMRARSVRGYKTKLGMLNGLLVSSSRLT